MSWRLVFHVDTFREEGLPAPWVEKVSRIVPEELLPDCHDAAATKALDRRLPRLLDTAREQRSKLRKAVRLLHARAEGTPKARERFAEALRASPWLMAIFATAHRLAPLDADVATFSRCLRRVRLVPGLVLEGEDGVVHRVRRPRKNGCPANIVMPLAKKLSKAGIRPSEVERAIAIVTGVEVQLVRVWRRRYQ
jgi:hypothetical protein